MTDAGTLLLLTLPLVVAAGFDWYVARRFIIAAIERPHIPMLSAGAWVRLGIAVSATITALLGIVSVWFVLTGQRIIPQPGGTILLYVATIVPSLANLSFLPVLRDDE